MNTQHPIPPQPKADTPTGLMHLKLLEYELHYKHDLPPNYAFPYECTNDNHSFLAFKEIWEPTFSFRECLYALFLNSALRVTGWLKVSSGGSNSTIVDVKQICYYAILSNCTGVVVAHNHPSSKLKASEADTQFVERLSNGLAMLNIKLVSSIIIGYEPQHQGEFDHLTFQSMDVPTPDLSKLLNITF